jgi:hypothetical protein
LGGISKPESSGKNRLQTRLVSLPADTIDEPGFHESFEQTKGCSFVKFGAFSDSSQSQNFMRRRKSL